MKHLKSFIINGMAFQGPMIKNREIYNIFTKDKIQHTKDKIQHTSIPDIKRPLYLSPISETIEEKPLDEIKRTIFSDIYTTHEKLGDFPDEKKVGPDYFSELEKDLKAKEKPRVRRIASVIDAGMKLAILGYTYNQMQNSNFSFRPNMINMDTFVNTFSFISNSLAVINLIEAGSSSLLGLENMRHGTSITNFPNIMLKGGQPSKGGNISGSSVPWGNNEFTEDSKNYFHVFLDKYGEEKREPVLGLREKLKDDLFHSLVKRVSPRLHTVLSGFQSVFPNINKDKDLDKSMSESEKIDITKITKYSGKTLSALTSVLCSPNINFYYHPESLPGQFVYDSHYMGSDDRSMAIKTQLPLTTEHLGIRGIIGEALSHPDATKKSVLNNLKDPHEVAYVSACILGAIVFSNFAKNDLNSILKTDPAKTVPEMTKYMIEKKPEFIKCLGSIGLKGTKTVFDMTANIIKIIMHFSINVIK